VSAENELILLTFFSIIREVKNIIIKIERVPLKGNEKLLIDFWIDYISDWKIDSNNILPFLQPAVENVWLYMAYNNDECCGLLVNEEGSTNAIWLLYVLPHLRRKGIGSALLNRALSMINGVWNAGKGSGYWWQGVPIGLGDDFLGKHGFEWSWTSIDMSMDLNTWSVHSPVANQCISKINKDETIQLINMLEDEKELCKWVLLYKTLLEDARNEKIFVAREGIKIVGCAMLLDEKDIRWSMNFSGRTGGIGCLGVRKHYQKNGIGAALVITLTNELKYLGFDYSYIGYTWLEAWYGRFGYNTTYRFKMGQRM